MALPIGLSAFARMARSNGLVVHGLESKLSAPQAQQKSRGYEGSKERDEESGEAYRYRRADSRKRVSLHVSACACQTGGATGEARLTMCLKIVDASIAEESEVFAS